MTEAQKGLITSKELGMAVADRLVQAEKRREVRGGETPPKQQTPTRRALQPPATREQRADRHAAPAVNHSGTQEFREDTPDTKGLRPYSFLLTQDHSRQNIPGTREYYDLDRARVGFPPMTDEEWKWLILREAASDNRTREFIDKECAKDSLSPLTDEEWKEYQRIKRINTMPIAELIQKYGIPNNDGKFIPYVPDSPDSKKAEKRTFWELIGEMVVDFLASAANYRKDTPAEKK